MGGGRHLAMRRALFQIHLWTGLAAGIYILVVCTTGAALVFRVDMQRALDPHLFTTRTDGPLAHPAEVMDRVSRAFPQHRLSGVEAPTTTRPTYLAYVTKGRQFLTVLVDPVSAEVLGELPDRSVIRTLQALHYDLLGGRTGRRVNGVGAGALLLLGLTGLGIWWRGRDWRRLFTLDLKRDGRRLAWALHRVVGIWTLPFLVMWALTGLYFAFPASFRSVVSLVSPLTIQRAAESRTPDTRAAAAPPTWREMVARAQRQAPGAHVARVVLPVGERGAFLVMFSNRSPTPAGSELTSVYLDQFTGERLVDGRASRSAGDAIMAWIVPLHVGGLGGQVGRVVWCLFGLGPPVLFLTGMLAWWQRVVGPRSRTR